MESSEKIVIFCIIAGIICIILGLLTGGITIS